MRRELNSRDTFTMLFTDYLEANRKPANMTNFMNEKEAKTIVNTLHYIKVAMVMLHSVAPKGIETAVN